VAAGTPSSAALRADCASCFALCCTAPAFAASADFAITKPAGQPCPNLRADFGCGIHNRLRDKGFPGCAAFDCLGAGQKVAQVTFRGRDWRRHPELAGQMFGVFAVMRQLHDLLWHLAAAIELPLARPVHAPLRESYAQIEKLSLGRPETLESLDLSPLWAQAGQLLAKASQLTRLGLGGKDHRGADLTAARLAGAKFRGTCFRSATLIGADLSRADLRMTDWAGADLRAANLAGADLTGAFFVTQAQLDAASGDSATRLPKARTRPDHWR
jgi:uncharacterized protein YjbI with pentapeptide repeats